MSESRVWRSLVRWMKFNLVGAVGISVQLAALWILTAYGLGYLLATTIAVEAAVLHNFVWHEHFTWLDRRTCGRRQAGARLIRFNLTTGAVSIGGNLLLMRWLVGGVHLPILFANLSSIAVCSIANFLVSDRWVFRSAIP